jgi:hypothetical protein
MSSGVILLNKDGVAFAADSAVTIGERLSIFQSFNKILNFGNKPIAGILYGRLSFMGISFNVIFKQACLDVFDKINPKNKLIDYLNDLFKYFEENENNLKLIEPQKDFVQAIVYEVVNMFYYFFDEKKKNWTDALSTKAFDNGFLMAENWIKYNKPREDYYKVDGSFSWIKLKSKEEYKNLIKDTFINYHREKNQRDFNEVPFDEIDTYVVSLVDSFLLKYADSYRLIDKAHGHIGFAIAGFGHTDIFPSLIHVHIFGYVEGKTIYKITKEHIINHGWTQEIEVVAQGNAINSFIDGISPNYRRDIFRILSKQIHIMIDDNVNDEHTKKKLKEAFVKEIEPRIIKEIDQNARNNWEPLYDTIRLLPIYSLCRFAEGLVNVQSLRSKYESDKESNATVGGKVNMSLITKSKGFEWFEAIEKPE